jgi:hypothetical protein
MNNPSDDIDKPGGWLFRVRTPPDLARTFYVYELDQSVAIVRLKEKLTLSPNETIEAAVYGTIDQEFSMPSLSRRHEQVAAARKGHCYGVILDHDVLRQDALATASVDQSFLVVGDSEIRKFDRDFLNLDVVVRGILDAELRNQPFQTACLEQLDPSRDLLGIDGTPFRPLRDVKAAERNDQG